MLYGCSTEELKTANLIIDNLKSMGVNVDLEPFNVKYYDVKHVKFEILQPFYLVNISFVD